MIEFKQKFIEDASDLLADLETTLLNLEKNPSDSKQIEDVFRTMHTLKGTAGMYGFDEIGTFTHRLENIYDLIRNGRISVDKRILDLTLESVDFLNKALNASEKETFTKEYAHFYDRINSILSNADENTFDGQQSEKESVSEQITGMQTWFITIKPHDDLRERGIKIDTIFDDLAEIGKSHIFNRTKDEKEGVNLFWELFLATEIQKSEIEDILIFIEDIAEIHHLSEGNLLESNPFSEKLDEFSKLPFIEINDIKTQIEDSKEVEKPKLAENNSSEIKANKINSIKVSAERLDEQMTLLSELVTANAELQLIVQKSEYKNLLKSVEKIEKITRGFRKNIFKIRLIPLDSLELRFNRLIRDLSGKLKKEVNFVTEGLHTELDKTIIDSLESPLIHLIRNSLDHGIQTADVREMRGKTKKGQIKLSARQAASNVIITVSDDGEGIDKELIRGKAIQRGLLSKKDKLTDSQLYELIFMPGFSTAQNLTEVSGRGVGMDVVKKTIQNLRGTITIKSEKRLGSSFTIKLPLTLSIIDTMLVKSGDMFYSIPVSVIDKCTEIETVELENRNNEHIVLEDMLFPYIILSDKLKTKNQQSTIKKQKSKVVIVRNEMQKTALLVDEIIGEHQAVLKPLAYYFKNQQYISGATQLADGHIALVLDIAKLLK